MSRIWRTSQHSNPYPPTHTKTVVVYALFLPAESYEQDMGCGIQPFNCPACWDAEKKLKFWWVVWRVIKARVGCSRLPLLGCVEEAIALVGRPGSWVHWWACACTVGTARKKVEFWWSARV